MSSLSPIFGIVTAATSLAQKAAGAVSDQFAAILDSAIGQSSPAVGPTGSKGGAEEDQGRELLESIAAELRTILLAAGGESGDSMRIRCDPATGEISVRGTSYGDAIEDAIAGDQELMDRIHELAILRSGQTEEAQELELVVKAPSRSVF